MQVGWLGLALLLGAAGCASTGRMMSYGTELADAHVTVGGRSFSIYAHPREPTLMLQAKLGQSNPAAWTLPTWREAAEAFVRPVGCGIAEMNAITTAGATWEATYVCPPGVDLRGLIAAQRARLKTGAPLLPSG